MRAQGKKVQRTASLALLTFGLIAHSAALAQTGAGAQKASGAQTAQTSAQNTWSVWFDNDQLAFVSARNERWYTQGVGLSQVSPCLGDAWRVLSLTHQMFTPASTRDPNPQPLDRPYAGVLYAGAQWFRANDAGRTEMGLELGVLGPSAGAGSLQRSVHRLIGQPLPQGWRYQLQDQPWLQLKAAQVWRLVQDRSGADLLARAGMELGHPRNALQAGLAARWGAVPAQVSWPGSAVPMTQATRGLMLQAHAQLQAVASDALLEGRPQDSDSQVRLRHWVPEAGLGMSWAFSPRLGVDAALVWRTRDFDGPASEAMASGQRWARLQLRGSFD